ncbi:MAG: cyclopropane fatty-acyl-phospholipid synthase-like methyltransferase [Kiritimatiellia bacterium]|jgi:cyclopropane fatty-acyl-phospholipid synthase-like methyltransferase
MHELPFSQACENNKQVILEILEPHLKDGDQVLELAGGTGQHCVHFAANLPNLHWQSSDIPSNVDNLNLRLADAKLANLPAAITIDVNHFPWDSDRPTAIFSANSLHIMSADSVENFFKGIGEALQADGTLIVYGPFKYADAFTSESNEGFDRWLKDRDPASGIRDFEWVSDLATKANLTLIEDNAMPANNQLLVWKKSK